jgi:hypothetical protein
LAGHTRIWNVCMEALGKAKTVVVDWKFEDGMEKQTSRPSQMSKPTLLCLHTSSTIESN